MTILWTILKIIGILLLVILGIFLALVLIVLLVPIRYRAEGSYHEKLSVHARITWLLHLISIKAEYEDEFLLSVRIAGIRIYPKKEKAKRIRKEEATEAAEEAGEEAAEAAEGVAEAEPVHAGDGSQKAIEADETLKASAASDEETAQTSDAEAETEQGNLFQRLIHKLKAFYEKLRDNINRLCTKGKETKATLTYYTELLQNDDTRYVLHSVLRETVRIIRHIMPRRLHAEGIIGTGDPASTGQVMAIYGMLYPLHRGRVQLQPDFEEKHTEGDFDLKGHITVGALLVCALRLILNRKVWQLIRLLRIKGGNESGRE